MRLDYRISFINDQTRLRALCDSLGSVSALALDIETINWWSPQSERVALIQLAYRADEGLRVAVVDALSRLDPAILRGPLEQHSTTKVIHNAAFDATRLARHFKISAAPIHDTMLAARRGGERRCSLQAQAERHLNLRLDKGARQSDWGLRPLDPKQLDYAALDAATTLLLYEHQTSRGLKGDYRLRAAVADEQAALPLGSCYPPAGQVEKPARADRRASEGADLSAASLALLGIVSELPSRYGPEQLAASVGEDRVGLAGWIIDRVLGEDSDLDESSAKIEIARLCQRGLVRITGTRRLEADESGRAVWQEYKTSRGRL
jgi:hypothetical protein